MPEIGPDDKAVPADFPEGHMATPAEPTAEDIAANHARLEELRDRVDRMTTPKAIVLSGYTVLGLAQASMVDRNRKAGEEWAAARAEADADPDKALENGYSWAEPCPPIAPLELQDVAAGVEARIAEALHEVVKALTMQSAADKGARAGLEKLMVQLMTDADVLATKVRSNELKLAALRRIADPDAMMVAELAVMAELELAGELTRPPTDNDADLAQAIGDLP